MAIPTTNLIVTWTNSEYSKRPLINHELTTEWYMYASLKKNIYLYSIPILTFQILNSSIVKNGKHAVIFSPLKNRNWCSLFHYSVPFWFSSRKKHNRSDFRICWPSANIIAYSPMRNSTQLNPFLLRANFVFPGLEFIWIWLPRIASHNRLSLCGFILCRVCSISYKFRSSETVEQFYSNLSLSVYRISFPLPTSSD